MGKVRRSLSVKRIEWNSSFYHCAILENKSEIQSSGKNIQTAKQNCMSSEMKFSWRVSFWIYFPYNDHCRKWTMGIFSKNGLLEQAKRMIRNKPYEKTDYFVTPYKNYSNPKRSSVQIINNWSIFEYELSFLNLGCHLHSTLCHLNPLAPSLNSIKFSLQVFV